MIEILGAAVEPSGLIAIVVAVLGSGIFGAIVAYRKAGPEAESIAAKTLIAVNSELREELNRRDKILLRCEDEIKALRERCAALEALVRDQRGIDPIPPPSQ